MGPALYCFVLFGLLRAFEKFLLQTRTHLIRLDRANHIRNIVHLRFHVELAQVPSSQRRLLRRSVRETSRTTRCPYTHLAADRSDSGPLPTAMYARSIWTRSGREIIVCAVSDSPACESTFVFIGGRPGGYAPLK